MAIKESLALWGSLVGHPFDDAVDIIFHGIQIRKVRRLYVRGEMIVKNHLLLSPVGHVLGA